MTQQSVKSHGKKLVFGWECNGLFIQRVNKPVATITGGGAMCDVMGENSF